jgi:hypothetical protein
MSIRDEIRELCIAHDRFMAEQASESIRRPPVSETDTDEGLIFKTIDDALVPAPAADADWSGWEAWMAGHLAVERQKLAETMGEVIATLRREWRQEIDRRVTTLQNENAELRGMLGATLTLLGQKSGNATSVAKPESDVVELARRRSDVA